MRMFAAAAAMAAAAWSGPSTGGSTLMPAPAVPPMILRVPPLVIRGEKDRALLTGNL